jgi:DNA-directed RNA polymerase subunit M/transcription elongation factor TFIIS
MKKEHVPSTMLCQCGAEMQRRDHIIQDNPDNLAVQAAALVNNVALPIRCSLFTCPKCGHREVMRH